MATPKQKEDKPIPINKGMRKANLYNEFILWSAMPPMEKLKLGIEHQKDFAEFYNVEPATLSKWKTRPDFNERMMKILNIWAKSKTPDVAQGIYRAAIKGNSDSQRLWFQLFQGWHEKQVLEHRVEITFGAGDIRNVIEMLPIQLRERHYANLRELLDDAVAARELGSPEDSHWTERPALPISGETYIDAQDVSDQKQTDVVARHYKGYLRANMVWEAPTNHYQSAAGRG